ncbi:hypothetical protein [Mycolicibacterium komossense]|uniref:hypothetical protein n=1 Tax=Mycolicibacterium komossense TaxID=1779 RepID=UPI0021F33D5D|nr:hypothetical protein [Mycolicibacterium komossense]
MAALGLSGCSPDAPESTAPSTTASAPVAAPQPTGLPEASVLIDLLNRLSDPALPGTDKLALVEGATTTDAADLDRFAKALQDNRMLPMAYTATDVAWSPDTPGDVTANVTATPADAGAGPFSFPMEFTAKAGAWQLSRKTADLLLSLGGQAANSTAVPTPTSTR